MNEGWHGSHRMPENPSRAQRVAWHADHAAACGRRDVPDDLAEEVRSFSLGRANR